MKRASTVAVSGLAIAGRAALVVLVYVYQGLSAVTPSSCRHEPSCSHYAIAALSRHGALRGGWLTLRRVARCHPWGSWGYDPVPETTTRIEPARGGSKAGPDSGNPPQAGAANC